MDRPKVAVIGAGKLPLPASSSWPKKLTLPNPGVIGLGALKNLLEEGFDVTAFEKSDDVGGIWNYTDGSERTSAAEKTQWNSCIQMSCYTDFPFPPGSSQYPYVSEVHNYIRLYCDHFALRPHIKFEHRAKSLTRINNDTQWRLQTVDKDSVEHEDIFDRIVLAVGQPGKPLMPVGISGLENFKGQILHGSQFKRHALFS